MKINDKTFLSTFGAVLLLVSIVIAYLHQLPQFSPFTLLSIAGITVYSLLTLLAYFLAKYYRANSMDTKYANFVYLNTSIKFLVTIILPVGFYFFYNKPRGPFILPFLLIYIVFTIYSTWLLNKMAVMRK
jgi:F0F1-type ATP synthase assembly protein I